MSITVVYRGGSFQPLEPVGIPEETVLQIELLDSRPLIDSGPPVRWGLGLGLRGPIPPDFKDIPPEFEEYV